MGLFGNRELQELKVALERAETRAQKGEAEIGVIKGKLAAAQDRVKDAESQVAELREAVKVARQESDRLCESKARADKAAGFYEERYESLQREAESARRSLEAATALEASARLIETQMKSENEILKAENERLLEQIERLRAARKSTDRAAADKPQPVAPATPSEGESELRGEVDGLKRRLAECDEMRRVALRKAEHNRRAWLVTQMQLDLAEDRICLLTTGKPRPVLESRFAADIVDGEIVQAEDVEGADEPTAVEIGESTAE